MKYKLIAIDMDGTLLNSNNQVSERTKNALQSAKRKGVHVVLSTGRVLQSALKYSKELDLINPIIASNGAIIIDENEAVLYNKTIDYTTTKKIVELAKSKNIYYHFYDEGKFYSHDFYEEVIKFYESSGKTKIDTVVFKDLEDFFKVNPINVYKFIFIDNDVSKLNDLRKELDMINGIGTSKSWWNNIEAMATDVSKGTAVRALCERLGVKPEEVMAIGDNENDLSMINFAGLGVAMGNAENVVKDQADYITDSNDEDGVAKAVEKFVLGQEND